MQNNNNTNPDNNSNQTPNRRQRQAKKPAAKKPEDRTDEAGYQKLPHGFRPFGGCAQRDPLDYDSHPYPSMLRFAKHLALHFDAPRTRHSYYRKLRLIHEQCGCDPSAIDEEMLRDYFLHVKTRKRWKSKTIRQAAAAAKLFFVGMLEQQEWKIFSQIRAKDDGSLPAVLNREEVIRLLRHIRLRRYRIPAIDPAVWQKDWGVHLQPFGSGENIIKYLGRYVCRTAIGDSRILSVSDTHVSFRWKDRANGDARRVETLEIRPPRPAARPAGRPLLRLLPPCGQSQARTHRLPHRTAAARRRAARHARETTPRRRLPVLWRADEKTATLVARLESRPRATTGETILRMIHAHPTIPMRGGIFQSHGPCPGELCPACGNNRYLLASYANPPDSTPVNPVGFMPTTVRFTPAMGIPRFQQPLLSEKLQTQNA